MDYLRDCYRGGMQPWLNAALVVPVRWYAADASAKFFDGPSVLRSSYWYDPNNIVPPVGELPNRTHGRGLCEDTWGLAGQHFCGPRSAMERGGIFGESAPLDLAPDGAALCCERIFLPFGGVEIGETWFVDRVTDCCDNCGGIPARLRLTMVAVAGMDPPDPNLNVSCVLEYLPDLVRWEGTCEIGPSVALWRFHCVLPLAEQVALTVINTDPGGTFMNFADSTPSCTPFWVHYGPVVINPFSASGLGAVTITEEPGEGP